ncbi:uncharacterized protein FRV6_12008 [Fusarium oxysporum]|uniref:Uncharacterized protein n=1 Tax=Fusarium oxysporum TaxID=5507 RepID=A0A2H3TQ64_FUSOX|nr:uncharacterized protein FRV6_12008 [Fusarium oxysporum]
MKYNILFVAAAAELLTVKLESRSQSQLSSRWNTADFPWPSWVVCVQRSQDFHPDVVEPRQANAASSCFLAFFSSGNNGMGQMTLGEIDTSEYEGELKKVPFSETVVSLGGSWYINNPAN